MVVWNWLNNKKTNIGTTCFLIAMVITNLAGIWEYDPAWLPNLVDTFEFLGAFFGGTGLAHKGVKKVTKQS